MLNTPCIRFLFLLVVLTPLLVRGQIPHKHMKIITQFADAPNDSLFTQQHSDIPYESGEAIRSTNEPITGLDSVVYFHGMSGMIIGPFDAQTHMAYVKVQAIDSSLFMHVGNVFLTPIKHGGVSTTYALAQKLAAEVHDSSDYMRICTLTDDNNTSPLCDLGWFSEGVMVKPFEQAIKQHRKGDCFAVQTTFGSHVVMVLDDSVRKRTRVKYCVLYLKK